MKKRDKKVRKQTISAVILTKNEEKVIENCLKSLHWVDEIMVIDDYSTDRTIKIAQKHGVKIFKRYLANDFASQRNFGLEKAQTDWVLFVDADEVVSKLLAWDIKKEIQTTNYSGFYLKRQDDWLGSQLKGGESGGIWLLRLGKKNAGQWQRRVHEVWKITKPVGRLKNILKHYPHQTLSSFLEHLNFHSSLHAIENLKEKKKPSLLNIIFYPILKFINNFFLKKGFLDQTHGFVNAVLMSLHSFLGWSKQWLNEEEKKARKNNQFLKLEKIQLGLIFLYLILFPFGQLLRFSIKGIPFHPIDLIVGLFGLSVLPSLIKEISQRNLEIFRKHQKWFNFWILTLFSLIFSLVFFKINQLLIGSLYFFRFSAYLLFFLGIYQLIQSSNFEKQERFKEKIFNGLIVVGLSIAVFGWFQYLFYPDLRPLIEYGWDDHLYRLTSTFLDPAFTGMILVLTFFLIVFKFQQTKKRAWLLSLVFLLVSIAFTYSRSSYLALVGGSIVFLSQTKRIKILPLLLGGFLIFLLLLPRPSSEGVKLERLNSVYLKTENYRQSLEIIKQSPLFGVGFNNLCLAKQKYLNQTGPNSHSCSGLDNSFLVVTATTGIIGLIIFSDLILFLIKNTSQDFYGKAFLVSGTTLIIHSFFTNTLFYSWILGWILLLTAISRRIRANS